jgi:hypothetical protein
MPWFLVPGGGDPCGTPFALIYRCPPPPKRKEEKMRIQTALAVFVAGLPLWVGGPAPLEAQNTTLTVQNERNEPVTVFVERVTNPVTGNVAMNARIGEVPASSTATFDIPEWAMNRPEGDLTFVVQVAGGWELTPVELAVQSGDNLGMIVVEQDNLNETLAAPTVDPGQASVTVLNNRAVPVLVLVEVGMGGRERPVHLLIGTASPEGETTMPIAPDLLGEGIDELRFVLHPLGGSDLPTQVVNLEAEDRIEIIVPE